MSTSEAHERRKHLVPAHWDYWYDLKYWDAVEAVVLLGGLEFGRCHSLSPFALEHIRYWAYKDYFELFEIIEDGMLSSDDCGFDRESTRYGRDRVPVFKWEKFLLWADTKKLLKEAMCEELLAKVRELKGEQSGTSKVESQEMDTNTPGKALTDLYRAFARIQKAQFPDEEKCLRKTVLDQLKLLTSELGFTGQPWNETEAKDAINDVFCKQARNRPKGSLKSKIQLDKWKEIFGKMEVKVSDSKKN